MYKLHGHFSHCLLNDQCAIMVYKLIIQYTSVWSAVGLHDFNWGKPKPIFFSYVSEQS